MKRAALATIGFLAFAPVAFAQVSATVGTPNRDDYWRGAAEGQRESGWASRETYRDEASKREDWQHSHCVRDWQNKEFCRK